MKAPKSKPKTPRESVIGHASEILKIMRSPKVVESKTMKLIDLADRHGALASCSPIGCATGVVYIAGILTENPVTLAVVSEAAGISLETVRKCKTRLARELKIKKK